MGFFFLFLFHYWDPVLTAKIVRLLHPNRHTLLGANRHGSLLSPPEYFELVDDAACVRHVVSSHEEYDELVVQL